METKKKAAEAAKTINPKVQDPKDFAKLIEFFRYTTATTLDAMFATGILRNSITWYVDEAEKLGLLHPLFIAKDSRTGRKAKHYSADPAKWHKQDTKQLKLWED